MLELSEYKGLQEKAAPGTHAAAWKLFCNADVSKNESLLDLATGNGAFSYRISDAGYTDISVSELEPKDLPFRPKRQYQWDLNKSFSEETLERYGFINAIEIIEHLDSPLQFLREARSLLNPNGVMLITTPNVQNIMSRLKFLLKGELKSFGYQDFIDQRHINGMTDHQIKIFFEIAGMRVLQQTSAGSFYKPLKKILLSPLAWFAKFLAGPHAQGDVNLYLVQKSEIKAHMASSAEHYGNIASHNA